MILCGSSTVLAGPSLLGSAQSFAALGYAGVTNAHNDPNPQTTIWGNVGVDPLPYTSITGFPPGIVIAAGGAIYGPGDPSLSARNNVTAAKTTLGLLGAGTTLGADLVGLTLVPGVYTVPAAISNLTGTLTLDGQGDADATWVFQMPSTLITSAGSKVNVTNTGSGAGVYWNVTSAATLGADTVFAGNILANDAVTLGARAEILCGRAFSLTASVTLIDNIISNNNFAYDNGSGRSDFGSYGFSGGGAPVPIPVPGEFLLVVSGLASLFSFRKRFLAVV
jgi:hypothetical protein